MIAKSRRESKGNCEGAKEGIKAESPSGLLEGKKPTMVGVAFAREKP